MAVADRMLEPGYFYSQVISPRITPKGLALTSAWLPLGNEELFAVGVGRAGSKGDAAGPEGSCAPQVCTSIS